MNDFEGYEKFYFLDGSASWRNIRGFLTRNIEGLQLFEEGSYSEPRVDTWGISDLGLFREGNQILQEQKPVSPFIAVIQTSENHPLYTIPDDNDGFTIESLPGDREQWQGFKSRGRDNGVRFIDHAIGQFIAMAQIESYFSNTIFVFHGDHGVTSPKAPHINRAFNDLYLTKYLSPLIFYAPELLGDTRDELRVASEIDVFPTLDELSGVEYSNQTLGPDLFNPSPQTEGSSLLISSVKRTGKMGIMTDQFLLWRDHFNRNMSLHDLKSDDPKQDIKKQEVDKAMELSELTEAMFETVRYMLYFNGKPEQADITTDNLSNTAIFLFWTSSKVCRTTLS